MDAGDLIILQYAGLLRSFDNENKSEKDTIHELDNILYTAEFNDLTWQLLSSGFGKIEPTSQSKEFLAESKFKC